jgi:hypothetical protein
MHDRVPRTSTKEDEKSEEARRVSRINGPRRSMSSEGTLLPEDAPPRYEDAVREFRH